MEILLEYKESCWQLDVQDPSNIFDAIEDSLKKAGWSGVLSLQAHTDTNSDLAESNVYFLQRWSHKWGTFIDVTDVKEIQSGNRLTIIAKPAQSPVKVCVYVRVFEAKGPRLTPL